MTKKMLVVWCTVLSFMFIFMAIGFAELTDDFLIMGNANINIPSGLFITKIETVKQSSVDVNTVSFASYSTTVDSAISKSSDNTAGSVTYRITVLNNTSLEYAYRGLYYQTSTSGYNNDMISTSNGNRVIGVIVNYPKDAYGRNQTIPAGEELSFEVTYTVGQRSSTFPARNTVKTLINYQFGINVNTEEEAIDAVQDKFLNILNTTSTYDSLIDVLDNKFDGSQEWTSNYVGNVGNATSDDAMAVNTLFAGQLQLIINGQTTPATVIIKHENLDNSTLTGDDYVATNTSNGGVFRGYGCEMTLYLTTHSLSKRDSTDGYAPVYVSVFTCDRDASGNKISEWYKIGDVYQGRANIVGYKGEADGEGSFVTDNWVATANTYRVTDSLSYSVTAGTTIKTLTQVVDSKVIAAYQDLLLRAKAIIDNTNYAGTGIIAVENAYDRAARFYTTDADGNPVAMTNVTRAQLCPIVAELEHSVVIAEDEIAKIEGNA